MDKNESIEQLHILDTAVEGDTAASIAVSPLLAYGEDDTRLLMTHNSYEVLKAYSPLRRNLLDFLDEGVQRTEEVLEVASGCGGLTGLLLDRYASVTSLTASVKEARVLVSRFKNPLLKVYAGTLFRLPKDLTFDCIIVPGLKEFILDEQNADAGALIKELGNRLRDGGRLILAVDNKNALKYWAGLKENMSGRELCGPYAFGQNVPGSCLKSEVEGYIQNGGFSVEEIYYPFPDYSFPTVLYSEEYLPKPGNLELTDYNFDNKRYLYFDENQAYNSLIEAGQFKEFCSSFLYVLKKGEGRSIKATEKRTIYSKFNSLRSPQFQIGTRMFEAGGRRYVEKKALSEEACAHIQSLKDSYEKNLTLYKNIKPLRGEVGPSSVIYPCLRGESARDILKERLKNKEGQEILRIIDEFYRETFAYNEDLLCEFENSDAFSVVFGTRISEPMQALPYADIDIIFDNIIKTGDSYTAFDYEWTFPFKIPVEFIRYRMMYRYYYSERARFAEVFSEDEFLEGLGFDEVHRRLYASMELSFQYYVYGANCRYVYTQRYLKKCVNIPKMRAEFGDLDDLIARKDAELRTKEQEYTELKTIYENTIHSRSYKVGAPLRAAKNLLRKMWHRVGAMSMKNPLRYLIRLLAFMLAKGPKRGIQCIRAEYSRDSREIPASYFVLSEEELKKQREAAFPYMPVISILVPLYNTPERFLREMIESVTSQTYGKWQLCLADGSDEAHSFVERIVKEYQATDDRILYERLTENGGISKNTNACLSMATGDFIGLFDHDDLLCVNALYEIVSAMNKNPKAEAFYTDEDKLVYNAKNNTCRFTEPHLKPDFNLSLLRSVNYICHFFVVRRSIAVSLGGFRSEFDGAQDYDFILRCTEQARCTEHVDRILYHWRIHEGSTAMRPESKEYCYEAGRKAIEAHLERCGTIGSVSRTKYPGYYSVHYALSTHPLVSILIPNKDQKETLETCVDSILAHTSYENYEILIIENNSTTEEIFAYYKELEKNERIRIVTYKDIFNYSKINNFGARYARGEYLLLLNNDIEVTEDSWLTEMLSACMQPGVGIVGARLLYPDRTIQHGGVIVGLGGVAGHAFHALSEDDPGYFGRAFVKQEVTAVTAACLLVRRSVYEELGGLEEKLRVAFNDIDFCLRVFYAGYKIIYNPDATLIHYESKTRGYEDTPEKIARFKTEIDFMQERHAAILEQGDPNYNRNLSMTYSYRVELVQ